MNSKPNPAPETFFLAVDLSENNLTKRDIDLCSAIAEALNMLQAGSKKVIIVINIEPRWKLEEEDCNVYEREIISIVRNTRGPISVALNVYRDIHMIIVAISPA